jgi:hypothetical protein
MRWARLFADLEGHAHAMAEAEADAEIVDQIRVELGRIALQSRLRAAVGAVLTIDVEGAGCLHGELLQVGGDWMLLQTAAETIVPVAAVLAVHDLPAAAASPNFDQLSSRLPLTTALRALVLDRCAVTVTLRDGASISGTPERVGADFIDLAVHALDEALRHTAVRTRRTLAFPAVAVVRRSGGAWS